MRRGCVPLRSTIVEGGPPGARPPSMSRSSCGSAAPPHPGLPWAVARSGSRWSRSPLTTGAVPARGRRRDPEHGRRRARPANRRPGRARGCAKHQTSAARARTRPPRRRAIIVRLVRSDLRESAAMRGSLCRQPALQAQHRSRPPDGGIDSEPVERVGGKRDDTSRAGSPSTALGELWPSGLPGHSRHASPLIDRKRPLPELSLSGNRGEEENLRASPPSHPEAASALRSPPDGRTSRRQDTAAVARSQAQEAVRELTSRVLHRRTGCDRRRLFHHLPHRDAEDQQQRRPRRRRRECPNAPGRPQSSG